MRIDTIIYWAFILFMVPNMQTTRIAIEARVPVNKTVNGSIYIRAVEAALSHPLPIMLDLNVLK